MSPAIPLPQFDRLVEGDDYHRPAAPTSDAASTAGGDNNQIPDVPQGQPSPLSPVSLATETQDAAPLGARQITSLHKDGWLNYDNPYVGTPER